MKLYHYTSHLLLESILKYGLMTTAQKTTFDGSQLGIYVTTDSRMNFYQTINDTSFDPSIDLIIRIEIDEQLYKEAKLDKEFHQFDDIEEEFDTFGCLMMYIERDIKPKYFKSIIYMNESNMRKESLLGEM